MKRFIECFKVPPVAESVIGQIITPEEIALIEAVAAAGLTHFTAEEASGLLGQAGSPYKRAELDAFLRSAYRRGVLLLEDESFERFKVGDFYGRLDVFAITENEKYSALPVVMRKALDAWYFGAYLDGLSEEARPTGDRVVSMDEAFDFIDRADRPLWLNRCDCRLLAGNCGRPTDTCITLKGDINTMSHRGWSKPLTKEDAKEVVKKANAAGLMQTVNPNGLCNCCGDCCYLFRTQKARGSSAVWPYAEKIAVYRPDACIRCGLCADRCNFGAFTLLEDGIQYDRELCRGCGLCTTTCPASAIEMKRRDPDEYGG